MDFSSQQVRVHGCILYPSAHHTCGLNISYIHIHTRLKCIEAFDWNARTCACVRSQ